MGCCTSNPSISLNANEKQSIKNEVDIVYNAATVNDPNIDPEELIDNTDHVEEIWEKVGFGKMFGMKSNRQDKWKESMKEEIRIQWKDKVYSSITEANKEKDTNETFKE
eukprot:CAMPEP_0201588530 /NCGR_PEP_ID=MMETSP0190_2-20130828/156135_1 /ASSEMBLY_ACC=CAM_ASM_000263 /TAXON_ID=37353 /ORGANISM="Rosalina sp." /LENGTH=108 /DNA_ID=CAMNT_0048040871 /DNA_START=82 /DNA_END=408 /DNA_ORIENTATION=-